VVREQKTQNGSSVEIEESRAESGHCADREGRASRRPLVKIKDLLWLAYLYPLRFLAATLPAGALYLIGRLVEPLYQVIARKKRREVLRYLTQASGPGFPAADLAETARRFIANAVFRVFDDLILHKLAAHNRLTCSELRGLEHLKKALAEGRGAIIVSGHFYASRVAKRYLAEIGYPMMSVRHSQPPDPAMGRLGERFLQPRYIQFLHGVIRDEVLLQDPDCVLKILKRLRAGGLVNIHVDAVFSPHAVSLPFLRTYWSFPTGFLRIARLSRCALVPMLCLGDSRRLTIIFDEPIDLDYGLSEDQFVSVNLPKLVDKLQSQILQYPDQWDAWLDYEPSSVSPPASAVGSLSLC
jgi:lauroyl/myristoyl acyltransferase